MPFEEAVLDKADALGARRPAFRMHEAPHLFACWSDRVALADSARARGRPYAALIVECDRQLGMAAARAMSEAPRSLIRTTGTADDRDAALEALRSAIEGAR